jgi:hypothetical protein
LRKAIRNSHILLKLLDVYLKSKEGDPEFLKGKKVFGKYLPQLKSRLYKTIIEVLPPLNTTNNSYMVLNEYINNFYFLRDKGLYKEAQKFAVRGYELSVKPGYPFHALLFQNMIIELNSILSKKGIPHEIISEDALAVSFRSAVVDTYIKKQHHFFNDKTIQNTNFTLSSPFGDIDEDMISGVYPSQQMMYYIGLGNAEQLSSQNPSQSYMKALGVLKPMLSDPNVAFAYLRYNIITGLLICSIKWNEPQLIQYLILEMESDFSHYDNDLLESIDSRKSIMPYECAHLMALCKFQPTDIEAISSLASEVETLYRDVAFIKQGKGIYHFSMAHASFLLQEFDDALDSLYQVFSIPMSDKHFYEPTYYQSKLLELMIHFEREKPSHTIKLAKYMKSYVRSLETKIHPVEKQLLSLFFNSLNFVSKENRKKQILILKDVIKESEGDDYFIKRIPYLNLTYWCDRIE